MAAYAALVSLEHIIYKLKRPLPPELFFFKRNGRSLYLLTQKIIFLEEFLEGYNPHLPYTTEADPLEFRIADAAHAAEDSIETSIVDALTTNGRKITLDASKMMSISFHEAVENVIKEMALIEEEATKITETEGLRNQLQRNLMPSSSSSSSMIVQQSGSSMVGADDVLRQMKDKLTSHCNDLQIIPIVGMGGTGKTTLARNIYQDRLVKEHFDICAWVTISQEYSILEILVEILRQSNHGVGSQGLSEHELGDMLFKHLFGRRYLIIMDDIWTIDAWEGIHNFFPDNKNGSRIVFTTRLSILATALSSSDSLKMEPLNEVDSWELLSKSVFGEKHCPVELEEIGKKIGKSCKGLPLSIVVVGGLLAKSEHTKEYWEYVEENLSSIVNSEDNDRCLKILHMSYKQLPVHLKPCFLYMGVFREDEEIHVTKLVKLWVAEGFIKQVGWEGLEEIGRVYLKELTDRNLVSINKMGIAGNIKECKIHDLLRDLCVREAEKERFYTVIGAGGETIPNEQSRRVVIHSTTSDDKALNALLSSMSPVRSLTWNVRDEVLPPLNLRLLRILNSGLGSGYQKNVPQIVNSRFLAFSAPPYLNPCSVWKFWNVETLVIKGIRNVSAPIWYMPHIRHVQFDNLYLPDPPNYSCVPLNNLQTLSKLRNFQFSCQAVYMIPNIKKLKISYTEGYDNGIYNLDKLECLHCNLCRRNGSLHIRIDFPRSLKKLLLHLNHSQFWDYVLYNIGMLPFLQKLTLKGGSFRGGRWRTFEGHFCRLKFLAIRWCNGLHVWETESSHFPCLERLLLDQLEELEEIPLDFAEISTLQVINVELCRDSVVVSAKRILEEQEQLCGEMVIQVQGTLLRKNEELESFACPNFCVRW